MFRASLPAADASDTSLRAGVEDNLAHRLRATAMEGGRAHDAIHRGFQSDRVGRDLDPDYPVGIRRPALPEEAGGTLALGTVSIGASPRDARIAAALCRRDPSSQTGVPVHFSTSMNSHSIYSVNLPD
jgi:hypothetical protein